MRLILNHDVFQFVYQVVGLFDQVIDGLQQGVPIYFLRTNQSITPQSKGKGNEAAPRLKRFDGIGYKMPLRFHFHGIVIEMPGC